MDFMQQAKMRLKSGCTCVAYKEDAVLTSTQRGVAPLLGWLGENKSLVDFAVADKVVGKGAAFLYLLLQVRRLHAVVVSTPALELLQQHNVDITYDTCVPAIRNRDNTGYCPIETVVLDCTDPQEAFERIRKRLDELRK